MRTYDATAYANTQNIQDAETADESVSVFDRYSSFDGTFDLTRDLRVEGQVKGTISCKGTLFVAQGATVHANVDAESITIAGDLNGEVVCRGRLQILPSGRVKGKISTTTLIINEGAAYEGELVMSTDSRDDARPARRQHDSGPSSAPSASAEHSGASATGGNTFIRRFGGQESSWDNAAPDDDSGT